MSLKRSEASVDPVPLPAVGSWHVSGPASCVFAAVWSMVEYQVGEPKRSAGRRQGGGMYARRQRRCLRVGTFEGSGKKGAAKARVHSRH